MQRAGSPPSRPGRPYRHLCLPHQGDGRIIGVGLLARIERVFDVRQGFCDARHKPMLRQRTMPVPVNLWKLPEGEPGNTVRCQNPRCNAYYDPRPRQSRKFCKLCRPPTQQCRHGVIVDFDPCPDCKTITGRDDQFVGLQRITSIG